MKSNTIETGALRRAKVLSPTPENISIAARAIQNAELVGMPTETVYGLAGDYRSPLALAKIFETKERPTFDPLIIHVGPTNRSLDSLARNQLVDPSKMSPEIRKKADLLIQEFWPGPLTLVFPKNEMVPDLATSGLPSVALRMPRHPVAQALIATSQTSLAAPSANRFGKISPTESAAVLEELGDRIDWILEGGPCEIGVESTILFFDEGEILLLRPGGTSLQTIEEKLGHSLMVSTSKKPIAPGMLPSHYAPSKPFCLLPKSVGQLQLEDLNLIQSNSKSKVGLLLLSGDSKILSLKMSKMLSRPVICKVLSPTGNLTEAAKNLFKFMRELDASPVDLILSEPCLIDLGIGHAIADRLKRASSSFYNTD